MSFPPLDPKATARLLNFRADVIEQALFRMHESHKFVDISQLGFLESFYLYCVLVAAGKHWCNGELPNSASNERKLAPTRILVEKIYASLHVSHVLVPNAKSSLFAFNIGAAPEAPITFDVTQVCWTIGTAKRHLNAAGNLTLLRTMLDSSRTCDREHLRLMLIQHECVGLFLQVLEKNRVIVGKNDELEILKLVEDSLAFVSPQALIFGLGKAFESSSFKQKINYACQTEFGSSIMEILRQQLHPVSLSKFCRHLKNPSETSILEASQYVVSSTFCKCLAIN